MRIVGVDDGAFPAPKAPKRYALLVAVLFDKLRLLNVTCGQIEVDGRDANRVLRSLLRGLRFDVVMLSGISFGGFNVVDIGSLAKAVRKPVIAITGERPRNEAVREALRKHFADWRDRWSMVRSAGRMHSFIPIRNEPPLYFEVQGGRSVLAKRAIASTAVVSRLPEPIRVARIVAKGLSALSEVSLP
jgi:endonuclease V-like protein UPF0215 family